MDTTKLILTADAVVFTRADGRWHVLLIERKWDPFEGRWALPGGHIDPGESPDAAAVRELGEETGLLMPTTAVKVGVYDAPGRDPRGRYATHAYAAVVDGMPTPVAADDARAARWVPLTEVTATGLAFDHGRIVTDAMAQLAIS
ncbi:NUDIX hydrolase [Actinokineospora auranticolor]|uniref:8-oxo-dGTP diphosphatase n=1 Tax=Actinokineospora auranticolor TaxID=155976 RepID=A0A2S6GKP2_9PSEU|nr:NUDIX hydrolase [Actinokineospora auranticolor]PPK65760.1 8-oxo-dGTP diphosphatase [Actinokineospora auranticolor]